MFIKKYLAALKVLLKKPVMLWGLSLLLALLSGIGALLTASVPVACYIVGYLFALGGIKLYMDGLKGKEVNSKQLFAAFNRNFIKSAGAMAWKDLWSFIWGFVPVYGVIKHLSYRFVPYIINARPDISSFDALKLSMKLTQGKKLQLWLADLVYFAVVFSLLLVFGLLAIVPYIGFFFLLHFLVILIVVVLFSNIFTGLYRAAFFSEEELENLLNAEASAAEIPAAEAE